MSVLIITERRKSKHKTGSSVVIENDCQAVTKYTTGRVTWHEFSDLFSCWKCCCDWFWKCVLERQQFQSAFITAFFFFFNPMIIKCSTKSFSHSAWIDHTRENLRYELVLWPNGKPLKQSRVEPNFWTAPICPIHCCAILDNQHSC